MNTICIVTGSRAEYGLLQRLISLLDADECTQLKLLVTGAHLSTAHGYTVEEIESNEHHIDEKVEMMLASDTLAGVVKSIGVELIGLSDALENLAPDLMMVLGDRYETCAAALAATLLQIPIAHLHGGEITEGSVDNVMRHAISKMAHLHFTSTEAYRKRLMQMGEQPTTVFHVGAIGLDNIRHMNLLSKEKLSELLGVEFRRCNLLVTVHPTTLGDVDTETTIEEILFALSQLDKDVLLIFTHPNADASGKYIIDRIENFCKSSPNAVAFANLGHRKYLSLLRCVNGVIGNSSSGIIEAPSFHIGTVNVGDRQNGRIRANSVIDVNPDRAKILSAIQKSLSAKFQSTLVSVENPHAYPDTSQQILKILAQFDFATLRQKRFYDLEFGSDL